MAIMVFMGRTSGLDVQYAGENAGIGSVQTWTDPRGDGKLWITTSEPNELIVYSMYSGGFPEMESSIRLETVENGTRVTWSSEGSLPSGAFYGYFASLFGPGMQREYDMSLARLKSVVEGKKVENDK